MTFDPAEKVRLLVADAGERVAEAQSTSDSTLVTKALDARAIIITNLQTRMDDTVLSNKIKTLDDAQEQQIALDALVAVPEPVVVKKETPAAQSPASPITAAVVAEDLDVDTSMPDEEVMQSVDEIVNAVAEPVTPAPEEEAPVVSTKTVIAVKIIGNEIAKIQMIINGFEKNLTLSITDHDAIVKEISKRTFLPIAEVNKTAKFTS